MANKSRALAKSSTAITRFDPKGRKELVIRGIAALAEVGNADFYFFKGEEARIKGKLRQAIDNYEKSLHFEPNHEDSLFYVGYCYSSVVEERIADDLVLDEAVRWKKAAETFQELIDVRSKKGELLLSDATLHFDLGVAQSRLGLHGEAMESYKRTKQLDPENAGNYNTLGDAQAQLGLYKEAIESCEQAIELWPEYSEYYKQLIKLDPENAKYYYRLGLCQQRNGHMSFALNSFEKYLILDVNNAIGFVETAKHKVKRLKQQDEGIVRQWKRHHEV